MSENKNWCVYCHTNKTNGKRYIGKTRKRPEIRWGRGGAGYKSNSHYYAAIQKYGWDGFEHEVLKSGLTNEESSEWERYFIDLYGTADPQKGYNGTYGGESGAIFTEEARKKMSDSQKRYFESEEARQRVSETQKKRFENPEERRKIAEVSCGFICVSFCTLTR